IRNAKVVGSTPIIGTIISSSTIPNRPFFLVFHGVGCSVCPPLSNFYRCNLNLKRVHKRVSEFEAGTYETKRATGRDGKACGERLQAARR
ncbi:hypothetical protein UXO93_10080, partial [Enterobacter hormaechei]|uniref:hypothetical protein n=1 Tax=Enterobacter hormaechei TaxID=158836 RepID=UPI0023B1CD2D